MGGSLFGISQCRFGITWYLGNQMVGQPEFLSPFAHAIDDAVGGPIGGEWVKAAGDFFVEHPVGEKLGMVWGDEAGGFAIHGMGEQGFGGIIKVDFTDVTQATDDG